MSHELLINDGEASMMYVGEPPWHGLGTKLNSPATAEEAISAAKLDWEVEKKPLSFMDGPKVVPVEDRYAVVPGDGWQGETRPVLGIVSKGYTPLQNRDAFRFFDPIVGQDAAVYHTAGVLGQGERIWILAKLPESIRVVGDDITDKYLLLSNNHDGHGAVQIKFTPIRVVCNNTLTLALSDGADIRVPHTHDLQERLRQADDLLGTIKKGYDELAEMFRAMTTVQMNADSLERYLTSVFPAPRDAKDEPAQRKVTHDRSCAGYFFESGAGSDMKGVRGTLWAAYNGVTEYIDHRAMRTSPNGRLKSIWFGNGHLVKSRALTTAKSFLEMPSAN